MRNEVVDHKYADVTSRFEEPFLPSPRKSTKKLYAEFRTPKNLYATSDEGGRLPDASAHTPQQNRYVMGVRQQAS